MAYTRLKYIESDGTQYIDTGFKPNQDTRVVLDVQLTQLTNADSGTSPFIFGSYQSSNIRYAAYWSATSDLFGTYYGGKSNNFGIVTDGFRRVVID